MRKLLVLSCLLCSVFAVSARAECAYPDSERGVAPAWLCSLDDYQDAGFLAYGDKSRLPSISLQNRLAGKAAMIAVVSKLLLHAQLQLAGQLPSDVQLVMPDAKDWSRVAKFKGVQILEKAASPQRHLYVLAGVKPELQADLVTVARKEILDANKKRLVALLGQAEWEKLLAAD
ncbi:Uncharacterised protein [Zhongshania aliphaticivorans]|uniref:Uncharacterized protein n=1 Tax=Zhongshania aliphaticivorans TaxID=1470434 RepID=A0A5S9MRI4_9GAMM|nr:hypothetical protein [Zhongshania aliphaticivorans]CAA0079759.1 Uncharacterised protein [Zhongshania aliphaticivorans]CAA0086038.1 Uncharacterised protein [Zhongshania aliphaticivorans]